MSRPSPRHGPGEETSTRRARTVTNREIPEMLRRIRRRVREWDVPVVGHYQQDPFQVLIACLLSLRTKDQTTKEASRRLFALARTPAALAALPVGRIEKAIYPVGFYKTKARRVKMISRLLLDRHEGKVPSDLDTLLSLPGVGRKTANLVVTLGFRKPGICVDTHVHRITNRWGYVTTKTPELTEAALRRKLPRRYWIELNDLLVAYGQNLCTPLSPFCSRCPLEAFCAKRGVGRSR